MPTVAVYRDQLHEYLGREYTQAEFEELCFQFGVELDEVTTAREIARKQNSEAEDEDADQVVYKIDVPANRQDILCLEGLGLALRVFLGIVDPPVFTLTTPVEPLRMTVKESTSPLRPFVVCAVLRGLKLDKHRYRSFLDLQEKLHFNICRRRTLVAIGTHDLDTLEPPFTYEAARPEEIRFVPLTESSRAEPREFNARELLDFYRDPANLEGKSLRPYTDIIYDSPLYPVIYDNRRTVLSLPPIINGTHSKISEHTRNCFIECTAVDHTKANIVLNTIIAMFSQYCSEPFSVEPVLVHYERDAGVGTGPLRYPVMDNRTMEVSASRINKLVGAELERDRICNLLTRMQLEAHPAPGSDDAVMVQVPPTRSDILHECDVAEDVAIAHGYMNIAVRVPDTVTIGREQPVNKLSDMLRVAISQAGYTEALTLGLCSHDDNFAALNKADDGSVAVVLSNPKTPDFQLARTSLLPGLLKTLRENKSLPVRQGIKLFEVSDVVLKDERNPIGARNERHLAAVFTSPSAGFEVIHGLLDRIMTLLHVRPPASYEEERRAARGHEEERPYGGHYRGAFEIRPVHDTTFFPGRCAQVLFTREAGGEPQLVGTFGVLHPTVLAHFELVYPASALELNLEPFV